MLKSIFFYVTLITTSITMGQTTTVSLEEYEYSYQNDIEIPAGSYIKDINNTLDKFEGSYTGRHKNWSYNIKLTKYVNRKTRRGFFEDFVTFEYTITNTVTGESYTNIGESVYEMYKSHGYYDATHLWILWHDPIQQRAGNILFSLSKLRDRGAGIIFAQNSRVYGNDEEYKEPLIPEDANVHLTKINDCEE
ncbi:MAG: hypothetical protein ACPGR7_03130 [Flavobacteriaceae bacterium]